MIPLSTFLIAWIVLLAIFGFVLMLTLIQMLRHGLPTTGTYISTFLFLTVIALVILGVGGHLTTVDWTTQIAVLPSGTERTTDVLFGL